MNHTDLYRKNDPAAGQGDGVSVPALSKEQNMTQRTESAPACPAWCDRLHPAGYVDDGDELTVEHAAIRGRSTVVQYDIADPDGTQSRTGFTAEPIGHAGGELEADDAAAMAAQLRATAADLLALAAALDGPVDIEVSSTTGTAPLRFVAGPAGHVHVTVDDTTSQVYDGVDLLAAIAAAQQPATDPWAVDPAADQPVPYVPTTDEREV